MNSDLSQKLSQALPLSETALHHLHQAKDIVLSSTQVTPGDIFLALQGGKHHGIEFAPDALKAGAGFILSDCPLPAALAGRGLFIEALADKLPLLLRCFYPACPETLVGVTGTNGKTSTVNFLRQIWLHAGIQAASLGTIGLMIGNDLISEGNLTSPDLATLYRALNRCAHAGVTHLALEASSHALDQQRLKGLTFKATGFTNLSLDHLDYHGSMEAYFAAKSRLFDLPLAREACFVINTLDPWGARLSNALPYQRPLRRLGKAEGELRLSGSTPTAKGQRLDLLVNNQTRQVDLPLIGSFQAENCLLAFGLALATGVDEAVALEALSQLKGVSGRLEKVLTLTNGAAVYVDFAHTPDALCKALAEIRAYTPSRLLVVFGAGGDRDKSKRKLMGEVASHLADEVFITDDNPRTEDPALIRSAIREGAPTAQQIADRREAIASALCALKKNDCLLIAGKGHERGQIIGQDKQPFFDPDVAREEAEKAGLL